MGSCCIARGQIPFIFGQIPFIFGRYLFQIDFYPNYSINPKYLDISPRTILILKFKYLIYPAGLGGSVGCAVRLETRRSRVRCRPRSATFFCGDYEIFSMVILSLPLIQEGHLSVSGKRMCKILVKRLEDWPCPVNVWLGKLTALDMTPLDWLGCKTSTQAKTLFILNFWTDLPHLF